MPGIRDGQVENRTKTGKMLIFRRALKVDFPICPTAFYDFLSYGCRIFITHPRKQC